MLKMKRFSSIVLNTKNPRGLENFSISHSQITSVKEFEREKIIHLALLKALLRRFSTKPFRQIRFIIGETCSFSHPLAFFLLVIHYYTSKMGKSSVFASHVKKWLYILIWLPPIWSTSNYFFFFVSIPVITFS